MWTSIESLPSRNRRTKFGARYLHLHKNNRRLPQSYSNLRIEGGERKFVSVIDREFETFYIASRIPVSR